MGDRSCDVPHVGLACCPPRKVSTKATLPMSAYESSSRGLGSHVAAAVLALSPPPYRLTHPGQSAAVMPSG